MKSLPSVRNKLKMLKYGKPFTYTQIRSNSVIDRASILSQY